MWSEQLKNELLKNWNSYQKSGWISDKKKGWIYDTKRGRKSMEIHMEKWLEKGFKKNLKDKSSLQVKTSKQNCD